MVEKKRGNRAPIAGAHPIEQTFLYPPWSKFPLKQIWIFYSVLSYLVLIPYWTFEYFVKGREHPRWSLGRQLFIRMISKFLQIHSDVGLQPPRLYRHDHWAGKRSRFVRIPAASDEYLLGSAATPNAKGEVPAFEDVPAYWYAPSHRREALIKAAQEQKHHTPVLNDGALGVLLFFHGGAYVTLTSQEQETSEGLGRYLVNHTEMDMLSVEYRLAGYYAYPSQLQDAISAYVHLTKNLKVPASRVILAGDSAGANLVIALTRYLAEDGAFNQLEMAGGAILFSPWLDMGRTLSVKTTFHDIVAPDYGSWGTKAILFGHNENLQFDPKLSPFYEKPEKLSQILPNRVYISCGGTECLRAEIEKFRDCLRKGRSNFALKTTTKPNYLNPRKDGESDEKNGVVYDVVEGAPHDFATLPLICKGESKDLLIRVSSWCKNVLK